MFFIVICINALWKRFELGYIYARFYRPPGQTATGSYRGLFWR
ncbi:hypothetical protein O5560_26700 [Escherichia coli]|nr:hypothetical protein [Escherichia coli]